MPDVYDETRTLRRRVDAVEQELARQLEDTQTGCVCVLAQVSQIGTYPTVAAAFYALQPVRITGVIAEGTGPTLTTAGNKFLGYNLGGTVPPLGSHVLAVGAGGRWTFRYG